MITNIDYIHLLNEGSSLSNHLLNLLSGYIAWRYMAGGCCWHLVALHGAASRAVCVVLCHPCDCDVVYADLRLFQRRALKFARRFEEAAKRSLVVCVLSGCLIGLFSMLCLCLVGSVMCARSVSAERSCALCFCIRRASVAHVPFVFLLSSCFAVAHVSF